MGHDPLRGRLAGRLIGLARYSEDDREGSIRLLGRLRWRIGVEW